MSDWGDHNTRVKRDIERRAQLLKDYEEEKRKTADKNRWICAKKDSKEYWRCKSVDYKEGMDSALKRMNVNYGNSVEEILGYRENEDLQYENENQQYNEEYEGIPQYYGIVIWECLFCGEDNDEDVISERLVDNWIVPMCNKCIDHNNTPCQKCLHRGCICETMNNDS